MIITVAVELLAVYFGQCSVIDETEALAARMISRGNLSERMINGTVPVTAMRIFSFVFTFIDPTHPIFLSLTRNRIVPALL